MKDPNGSKFNSVMAEIELKRGLRDEAEQMQRSPRHWIGAAYVVLAFVAVAWMAWQVRHIGICWRQIALGLTAAGTYLYSNDSYRGLEMKGDPRVLRGASVVVATFAALWMLHTFRSLSAE